MTTNNLKKDLTIGDITFKGVLTPTKTLPKNEYTTLKEIVETTVQTEENKKELEQFKEKLLGTQYEEIDIDAIFSKQTQIDFEGNKITMPRIMIHKNIIGQTIFHTKSFNKKKTSWTIGHFNSKINDSYFKSFGWKEILSNEDRKTKVYFIPKEKRQTIISKGKKKEMNFEGNKKIPEITLKKIEEAKKCSLNICLLRETKSENINQIPENNEGTIIIGETRNKVYLIDRIKKIEYKQIDSSKKQEQKKQIITFGNQKITINKTILTKNEITQIKKQITKLEQTKNPYNKKLITYYEQLFPEIDTSFLRSCRDIKINQEIIQIPEFSLYKLPSAPMQKYMKKEFSIKVNHKNIIVSNVNQELSDIIICGLGLKSEKDLKKKIEDKQIYKLEQTKEQKKKYKKIGPQEFKTEINGVTRITNQDLENTIKKIPEFYKTYLLTSNDDYEKNEDMKLAIMIAKINDKFRYISHIEIKNPI